MRRNIHLLVIALFSLSLISLAYPQSTRVIRVGVYENAPKIYTETDGTVAGFWPDLIQYIAQKEGWKIIWVHGTWEESLDRLKTNEIDILPDVGWTPERAQEFAFSTETVLVSWARLYVPEGSSIQTILDLDGKKVAGLAGSLNFDGPEGIKELAAKFDIHCTFIGKDSYTEVFEALNNKEVDAGITNKDFGDLNEHIYNVIRTPVIIQPTSIQFAFTQEGTLTPYLMETLDSDLINLKADSKSYFYKLIDQYFGQKTQKTFIEIIPPWVYTILLIGGGIILFLLAVSVTARGEVQRQTAELRTSESRYRALLENIPDLIFRLSGEGVFLDYHSAVENRFYVQPQEFLGKKIGDILPPGIAEVTVRKINKALETNDIQMYEYQLPVDGEVRDFEARYTASGSDEVTAIIRDTTTTKKAERELWESQKRYETLARVSPVGIFYTDTTGYTTYVNPTWCKISGLSAEEGLGEGWLNAVYPDDRQTVQENWNKSTRMHKMSSADYRFVHPDGSVVWVIGQAVPEIDSNDQVVGYVGTITDITERKQVEAALQRSISSEHAALIVAKTIQDANLALSRSLDLDEILQVLLDHLRTIVPFDSASVLLLENKNQLIVSALRGALELKNLGHVKAIQFNSEDYPVFKKVVDHLQSIVIDNTSIYDNWKYPNSMDKVISWMGVPLIAGGQVLGLYSLCKTTDSFFTPEYQELGEAFAAQAAIAIQNAKLHKALQDHAAKLEQRVVERTTELANRVSEVESLNSSMISLNEELKEAVFRAESADKLKSAFLATMSHELRTPLNSIIGFTGILLQKLVGPLSEEQEKQLKMVQSSARHLLELINDVLDISKIEAGQIDVIPESFTMENAIQKSVEKIIPMADKKGLVLTSTITPGSIEMFTDRRRVEQILINLLTNAVKFTDKGEVHLETHIENNYVVTRIIDTGIGIKPEDMAVLFKPFQQIDTGITRQYEGTGLGLSICKRLVELLGGKIWVESEWGKGSTFIITLPLLKEKI